jgi:pSer/pThr/pTyr-binding forkhead associated (FHA) protein
MEPRSLIDDSGLPPDFIPLRLVLEGTGATVELRRVDNLVGRHSQADVRLPLPDVSRRHCRLIWLAGRWQVVDLNSLNGIFVNDAQVHHAPLNHGDKVRIGGFTFSVEVAGPALDHGDPTLPDLIHRLPPPQRRAS